MRIHILLFIPLLIISFLNSIAQEYYGAEIRRITINYNDSIVDIGVAINGESIELEKDLIYYWYYSNTVSANQGGYYGMPLHGQYSSFTAEKILLEQGYFNKGLKTDTWVKWFENGRIREIYNWKNGLLHGVHYSYSETGELLVKETYRTGQKHGTQHYFSSDSIYTAFYRNGRIVNEKGIRNLFMRLLNN